MAEALITVLIEQLGSMAFHWIEDANKMKRVKKDVSKLKSNFEAIQAVLKDAEKRQFTDASVRNWLEKLTEVSHDVDDVLDEWNTFLFKLGESSNVPADRKKKKVCFSMPTACFCFTKVKQLSVHRDVSLKIKELNERLDLIANEKDKYNLNSGVTEQPRRQVTTSFILDETEIRGRNLEKDDLVSNLLSNSCHEGKRFDIIPIVGMGGIGKSTLCQLAYNDDRITAHFDEKIWVCVSDPFDELKIAGAIVEGLGGDKDLVQLEALSQCIHGSITGKTFLLVLDDVWTEERNKWEQLIAPLKNCAGGSKILVTTRKKDVAIMMRATIRMVTLSNLSDEDCWRIFRHQAFAEKNEAECQQLEETGKKIACKCKGLPLIAKILGSFMQSKETKNEWESVLNDKLWELKKSDEIFAPFLLSYYNLPLLERRCFLYCAMFPKDHVIKVSTLLQLWISQGYFCNGDMKRTEQECQDCFNSLARRSFFQEFNKSDQFEYPGTGSIISCKMHDIVHDFAQFLTKKECVFMEVGKVTKERKLLDDSIRHLTLQVEYGAQFPTLNFNKANEKNIRTLVILPHFRAGRGLDSPQFSHLTHLRTLLLSACGLQQLSSDIGRLIHLRYLDLSKNGLKELPDTMFGLCNLQSLILSECSLVHLPNDVGKLKQLRYLDLSENSNLPELPVELCGLSNLQTLLLSSCHGLKKLPDDLGKLAQLITLDLTDNQLEELPVTIGGLCSLQHLDLLRCGLKKLPEDVGKLVHLEYLNLSGFEDPEGLPETIRNLSNLQRLDLSQCRMKKLPDVVSKFRNLRSLNLSLNMELSGLPDTLCDLCNLESLNVSLFSLEKLPEHIGKLRYLRYLDLSCNNLLKELPESLCDLYNLQSLDVRSCWELQRLPKGIGKLVNVRYLDYSWCHELEGLPKALRSLDCLQPTDLLIIPKDKEAYLDFGDIRSLKEGAVDSFINGCGNLAGTDETKKLGILVKGLKGLQLKFRNDRDLRKRSKQQYGIEHDNEILKAFELPQNLTHLRITNYLGTTVSPRWMMSSGCLSHLELADCHNFESLPSLGRLPFLESLSIGSMKRVKMVGLDFLGVKEHRDEENGATNSPFVSFPRLKELVFWMMLQWEEWEGGAIATGDTNLKIMPCLHSLELWGCNSFKALPDFLPSVPLKSLSIGHCKILQHCCQKDTGKEWVKISHIPDIEVNSRSVQKYGVWIQEDNAVLRTSQSDDDVIDVSPLFSEQIV